MEAIAAEMAAKKAEEIIVKKVGEKVDEQANDNGLSPIGDTLPVLQGAAQLAAKLDESNKKQSDPAAPSDTAAPSAPSMGG